MTKPRILVVEDERIVNLDIQGALARLGYVPVGAAGSGEEAVETAAALKPDLVLMDIHLAGGMDGTEAADKIRRAQDTPVVFLTAHADEETMLRALSTAPFGYLLKPFEDRELRGVIELALAKSRQERDLRRVSQAKSAFLGAVSHELRAPIDAIAELADGLLRSGLDETQRALAERISGSARDFGEVLARLLDFSRLDEGAVRDGVEVFDPRALLERVARPHRVEAGRLGLDFSLRVGHLPARLQGNRAVLSEVLDQLLGSALRNARGAGVALEAEPGPEPADPGPAPGVVQVLFSVRGVGRGGAAQIRLLSSEPQARPEGQEVALALCERQVELLGGRIWAEGAPGEPGSLRLAVPLARVGPVQGAEQAMPGVQVGRNGGDRVDALMGARILIVEDDLVNRMVLTRALERSGALPRSVEDGRQALEALGSGEVDALVLDLQLPYLDGVSIARMVRTGQTGVAADTPIVALSADATEGSRQRCLQAGMDHALSKPVDLEQLKNLLRDALGARRTLERPC